MSVNIRFSQYRSRANKKNIEFSLNLDHFKYITNLNCWHCKRKPESGYVGIDRISNNIGYTTKNSSPCCWDCNRAKSNMTRLEFYKYKKLLAVNCSEGH